MSENELTKEVVSASLGKVVDNSKKSGNKGSLPGLIVAVVVLAVASVFFWSQFSKKAGDAANAAYQAARQTESESVYSNYYEKSYASAEEKAHVKNIVSINVESLSTEPKLEVLRVSDVEYAITDPKTDGGNVSSWLEIPGIGIFTVDLSAGEFIVDDVRERVLVRVPYPKLTQLTLDYENVKELFWSQGYRNYSYKDGEDLAQSQLNEGYIQLQNYMNSNEKLFLNAKDSAVNMITFFVKELNPAIPNLQVDVEFMD